MDGGGVKKGSEKKNRSFFDPPLCELCITFTIYFFPDLSLEISGNSGDLFFVDLWGSLGISGNHFKRNEEKGKEKPWKFQETLIEVTMRG